MRAIRVHKFGGPEVLTYEPNLDLPQVGAHQVRIRVAYAGVNFVDVYKRTGLYPSATPFTLGGEAVGVVDAVGADVKEWVVGARVATVADGGYSSHLVVAADRVLAVPQDVPLKQATAALIQGMTAQYLTHSTHPVHAGETVLVHAAAGGTGQMIVHMCKAKGARVIGTVGSAEKVAIAKAAGADHVINYSESDFESEVKRLTERRGVNCVYDSIGAATWQRSLHCCAPLGHLVLFGNASGKPPSIDPLELANQGSITLTRPRLGDYIAAAPMLHERARDVFAMMNNGGLKVNVCAEFPLERAADAHRFVESRQSTGKVILVVDASLQ